jgi:hypothetical protein
MPFLPLPKTKCAADQCRMMATIWCFQTAVSMLNGVRPDMLIIHAASAWFDAAELGDNTTLN